MRAGHLSIKPGRKEQCADTMQGDASIENETWSCSFLILWLGWGGEDYPAMFSVEDERGVKVGYPKRVVHQSGGK